MKKINLICDNCGKEFYKKQSDRLYIHKFCCRKCYIEGTKKFDNKGRFKKGNIPPFKGIKGIHLSPKTEFKKGQVAHNKLKIGSITYRKNKYGKLRKWIKVGEPNIWRQYADYIWEKENGKLPNGMIIHHKNKNKLDDRIENLECLTKSQHINKHRKELINGRKNGTAR